MGTGKYKFSVFEIKLILLIIKNNNILRISSSEWNTLKNKKQNQKPWKKKSLNLSLICDFVKKFFRLKSWPRHFFQRRR